MRHAQHEVPTSLRGFEERHDRRLLTVFTASNYCGMAGNHGAIVVFDSEMSYTLEEHMAPGAPTCLLHAACTACPVSLGKFGLAACLWAMGGRRVMDDG